MPVWPDVFRGAIEATAEAAILPGDIIDRDPSPVWGRGRVTLLGDAIHATTPNLGQGACQALEDAVVLAHCLRTTADPVPALRAYEDQRRDRTAMVTRQSRSLSQPASMTKSTIRSARRCRGRNQLKPSANACSFRRKWDSGRLAFALRHWLDSTSRPRLRFQPRGSH